MLLALFHVACGSNNAAPTVPVTPVNHSYPFSFSFGTAGPNTGQFNAANGIVIYQGALFVTDSTNNNLQKFDLNGNFLQSTLGNPAQNFSSPYGIAVDSTGVLYVVDDGHNLIQKLDRNLNYLSSFGSIGTGPGQFTSPEGVGIDSTDRVYVTEVGNNRIQRCSNIGTNCLIVGGTTPSAAAGLFNGPTGISIDKSGNVWVADHGNYRIQKFDSNLAFIQAWGTLGIGNGQFGGPSDVRVDQDGNVIVADLGGHGVQKLTASGTYIQQIGTSWGGPKYTAFDSNNNLYVTDWTNNTVSIFRPN